MYHSQSQFALITSAHEAEKAITPRRNIISLCSHYTQASTERLVNGVGNPFLSIFLWPLTMKASKVMKLWRLCLLAQDQSGCSNRKWEKDESRVWGARRQTMLFQDRGGLIMMVSQPSLLTTMLSLSPLFFFLSIPWPAVVHYLWPALLGHAGCELQEKLLTHDLHRWLSKKVTVAG